MYILANSIEKDGIYNMRAKKMNQIDAITFLECTYTIKKYIIYTIIRNAD